MNGSLFYQSESTGAIPLTLWTPTQFTDAAAAASLTVVEQNSLAAQQFKGNLGDLGLIFDTNGQVMRVMVGLGQSTDAMALAMVINRLPLGRYRADHLSTQALLNWGLAQYRFDSYKNNDWQPRVLCVTTKQLTTVLPQLEAIFLVRDLINMPSNQLNPATLAEQLEQLANAHQGHFKQWIGDELIRDNFPAIHAVGRAAAIPPRLLSLTWGDKKHPHVALVGKGVCFDAGGLDIKPSNGMRLMKKDMGGAAHVIGLAQWLMTIQLPIYLQVWIPAVENVLGSRAYRPGDVLTMRNGLTVEVDNTDAEGRLVLADAIVKACETKPELLIDFATLTGAARVAVGTDIAAMFTNDEALATELTEMAQRHADPIWRLPLFAGYEDLFKSNIADMANSSGSSYAGAIVAALFLQRYVPKALPWVHFDMMAWNLGNKPGRPEGGEAMGLLAMGQYLIARYG